MTEQRQFDKDCLTCRGDPAVCATVPGLRHCEKAMREYEASVPECETLSATNDVKSVSITKTRSEPEAIRNRGAQMSDLAKRLREWLRDNAPDCGDNSCLFGGRGKGGMRTNGGCRCYKDVLPDKRRIYIERMQAFIEAAAALEARDRDAARWRWARADKILWSGTYDYGVISPEDADAIADATVVQGDPALDSKPNLP